MAITFQKRAGKMTYSKQSKSGSTYLMQTTALLSKPHFHTMDKAELRRRVDDFDETANVCGINLDGPEELLNLLYEDFAVSAGTFFHPINLDVLLHAGIITEEIKRLCIDIEHKVDYLTQNPTLVGQIKGDKSWEIVFALCKQVRHLKHCHSTSNQQSD